MTKNAEKLESWKVKRSETKFIEGNKYVNLIFFDKIHGRKFIEKSREVSFKYSETHGKNISVIVTPWSIKDVDGNL